MSAVLLSLHVLAAVVTIGPVCVAGSMFPAEARRAVEAAPGGDATTRLVVLARICRVYAVVGLAVPLFGLMTGASMGILGETWLMVSIALTAAAFLLLVLVVVPRQAQLLAGVGAARSGGGITAPVRQQIGALAATTGVFNLLWAAVTVMMIIRPGSTTRV